MVRIIVFKILRKEFEMFKKSWEEEKKCLKQKIKELNTLSEEQKGGTPQKMNNSVQRILAESPVPLPSRRRLDLMKCDNGEVKGSPTLVNNTRKLQIWTFLQFFLGRECFKYFRIGFAIFEQQN